MMTPVQLTDGVVLLSPMTLADAEGHLAGEDEVTARFLSGGRSTIETVTASIERNRISWETRGPVRCFGIREKATGRLVGMVEANLATLGFRSGTANVSYGLYPVARGRGYATRAVCLLVRYLAEETDVAIAVIQVDPENQPSARVPVRAGFGFLGDRMTPEGNPMITFGLRLRSAADGLTLSDVCEC